MKEGKWEQIRDISQKSSPLSVAETESLISPLSPSKRPADDLGRGKRIKFQNPKYSDPTSPENVEFFMPTALNFDDLALEDNADENWEPESKIKKPKPQKKEKCTYEETILAGERIGLDDYQIAMMVNAFNL